MGPSSDIWWGNARQKIVPTWQNVRLKRREKYMLPNTKPIRTFTFRQQRIVCIIQDLDVAPDICWIPESIYSNNIVQIYQDLLENASKNLPTLTHDHVHTIPFSVMIVKYAMQILSKTMLVTLSTFATTGSTVTAKYCEIIDSFFDWLNLRSLTEKRKT